MFHSSMKNRCFLHTIFEVHVEELVKFDLETVPPHHLGIKLLNEILRREKTREDSYEPICENESTTI